MLALPETDKRQLAIHVHNTSALKARRLRIQPNTASAICIHITAMTSIRFHAQWLPAVPKPHRYSAASLCI